MEISLCSIIILYCVICVRAGEPESESERPEPHDLAGAIIFFLQEPEHFKKLERNRSWSLSWHELVRLQAPAAFKNFLKNNDF